MATRNARRATLLSAVVPLLMAGAIGCGGAGAGGSAPGGPQPPAPVPSGTGHAVPGALRLSGTVEAVRARAILVPRLAGQISNSLIITHLVKPGALVKPGDLLVEFDRQDQIRNTLDRRAEIADLDSQIDKKRSDQTVTAATDATAMAAAQHDFERARLDALKNDLVARIEAEKNTLALEQATARVNLLKSTSAAKEKAAAADVKVLEIRRERSAKALAYAEKNITLMEVRATFDGVVVLKTTFKGQSMGEVMEGDEVRPGQSIMDVIDPSLMQVRARVNQADIGVIEPGRVATIRLDAYPELSFTGRIESVAPLAVPSPQTTTVRAFTVLVSIQGTHPRLMPDLTASVDVAPAVVARK